MAETFLKTHRKGLFIAVGVALYLQFFLLPTATLFYEAYHVLKIESLYIGYQLFKVAAYSMSVWQYRHIAILATAMIVFLAYFFIRKIHEIKCHRKALKQGDGI